MNPHLRLICSIDIAFSLGPGIRRPHRGPPRAGEWPDGDLSYVFWLGAYFGDPVAVGLGERLRPSLPTSGPFCRGGAKLVLLTSVEPLAILGKDTEASLLYERVADAASAGTPVYGYASGLVEKTAGISAAAGGRADAAVRHFEAALALAHDLDLRTEQAEVRCWYARMLLGRDERGDRERARQLLSEARAGYERIGMAKHVEMADALRLAW